MGLNADYTVTHDTPSHAVMTDHRHWAFGTVAAFLTLGLWQWFQLRRGSQPNLLFVVALVFASGHLTVTGWQGGELVFRYGLGVLALPESEGPGHSHEHAGAEHSDGSPQQEPGQEDHHPADAGHDHGEEMPAGDGGEQGDGQSHGTDHDHEADHTHEGAASGSSTDRPAATIRALHTALASGDQDAVLAALAPDVLIFEGGSVERSRAKYAGHHMKSDMAFLAQMEREIFERDAAVQGNSASIVTESRIKGRYKERDIDLVSTETAVLERDADSWKIVHLHWSSRAPESH